MHQIYPDVSQQRGGKFKGLPLSIDANHQITSQACEMFGTGPVLGFVFTKTCAMSLSLLLKLQGIKLIIRFINISILVLWILL